MTSQVQTQIQNLQNWVICEPFNLPESHEYYVKGVYKLQLMCHSIPCYMTVGSMVKPINAILPLNDIVNNIVSKLGEWEALLVEDLTFYDE
ncbi:MAG: hypothetical protein LM583_10900, partial [Desulfurococcaceae archaeon]|nr:hypothetical protein [Desulfurococcaceae archaeon]